MIKSCYLEGGTPKGGLALERTLGNYKTELLGNAFLPNRKWSVTQSEGGVAIQGLSLCSRHSLCRRLIFYQLDQQKDWKPCLGKWVGKRQAKETPLPIYANQAANKPAGPTSIFCTRGEATVKFSFVDFIFPFGTYAYFALVLGTLWVGRIYSVI